MANATHSGVATATAEGKLDVLRSHHPFWSHAIPTAKSGSSSIAELKNGKVHFKQKCISFEKQSETLQEIVQFREMLTTRIEKQETPLDSIPDEHQPVIAKLAHESDKTLAALSKHIRLELLPTDEDEDGPRNESSPASIALPLNVVEAAIKSIMLRNNYGLDGVAGSKVPAAVCVWRWEVKSEHWDWLPKSGREKAEARQKEREQAKEDLLKTFQALPQDEQDKILDPKGTLKASNKDTQNNDSKATSSKAKENQPSPAKSQSGKKDGEDDTETPKKGKGRAPKVVDPEKAAREQEKAEKKAAKAEKEKKELDAKKKSQSLMANFFTKPKKGPATPSGSASNEAGPSVVKNEFDKYFKPFVTKKDTTLASINYFSRKRKGKQPTAEADDDVIIIEDDDPFMVTKVEDTTSPEELSSLSPSEHVRSIIRHLPAPLKPKPRTTSYKPSGGFKTQTPLSVRDVFSKLSEAEVTGDANIVRGLHNQLSDRAQFPAKVLIFHGNARPGYFGTWTRQSRIIGPRTPLAKDVLVFDYAYDSGEEWEEEPAGDADDVMDDEEEDGDGEERDSDLDSWLVDDDQELDESLTIDDRELSPSLLPDLPPRTGKRKPDEGDKKAGKKRKIVVPLVAFSKGPCWETSIGDCDDFMDQFRIQLFNDAPFPLDPFTYVAPIEKPTQAKGATTNDTGFAVPDLPDRLLNGSAAPTASSTDQPPAAGPKKPAVAAKTAFPEALLPQLLTKINTLQTKSFNFLVDSIYQDLKDQNVKKNAIEAKVREVGEKSKGAKVWVVKPDIQVPS